MRIALFGHGFLGKEIAKQVKVTDFINRSNYKNYKNEQFDIFINATGNSRAYEVNKEPHIDCNLNICSVYNTLFDFKINKYIYFSSIATTDIRSNYGFNKKITEEIILRYAQNPIILRCSSIIDKNYEIGLVADILKNKELMVTHDSRYQFISKTEVGRIVSDLVYKKVSYNSIYNLGGIGSIAISDIGKIANKEIKYSKNAIYKLYEMDVNNANKDFGLKTTEEYIREIVND